MLLKSEAVVLGVQKIKDASTLVHLYTRECGRVNLLVYGAQSKRRGNSSSALYPLSLVTIEADIRNSRELNTLKEVKMLEPTHELLFNPIKSTLAFFLAEVLQHCLRTNEQDCLLFDFVRHSVAQLHLMDRGLANFHICFLVRLSRFLGFQPTIEQSDLASYFDMEQAEFCLYKPLHGHYLNQHDVQVVGRLLRMNYRNMHLFRFTREERGEVLEKTLDYFRIHQQGFGELKSLPVLREVLE